MKRNGISRSVLFISVTVILCLFVGILASCTSQESVSTNYNPFRDADTSQDDPPALVRDEAIENDLNGTAVNDDPPSQDAIAESVYGTYYAVNTEDDSLVTSVYLQINEDSTFGIHGMPDDVASGGRYQVDGMIMTLYHDNGSDKLRISSDFMQISVIDDEIVFRKK